MSLLKSFNLIVFSTLFYLFTLNACTTTSNQDRVDAKDKTICTNPRPLICTRDYRPVCAESKGGRFRTYSNGCSACSNPDIVSYLEGDCPKGK